MDALPQRSGNTAPVVLVIGEQMVEVRVLLERGNAHQLIASVGDVKAKNCRLFQLGRNFFRGDLRQIMGLPRRRKFRQDMTFRSGDQQLADRRRIRGFTGSQRDGERGQAASGD